MLAARSFVPSWPLCDAATHPAPRNPLPQRTDADAMDDGPDDDNDFQDLQDFAYDPDASHKGLADPNDSEAPRARLSRPVSAAGTDDKDKNRKPPRAPVMCVAWQGALSQRRVAPRHAAAPAPLCCLTHLSLVCLRNTPNPALSGHARTGRSPS